MIVTVDNVEREWSFSNDCSLNDAYGEIVRSLLKDERRVVNDVQVCGYNEDANAQTIDDKVKASDIQKLKVHTVAFSEYCADCVSFCDSLSEKLKDSTDFLDGTIDAFLRNQIDVGMQGLQDILENFILFYNFVQTLRSRFQIDFSKVDCGDGSLDQFINRTKPMLEEMEDALKRSDLTMVNDYLEYEVKPTLGGVLKACESLKAYIKDMPDV